MLGNCELLDGASKKNNKRPYLRFLCLFLSDVLQAVISNLTREILTKKTRFFGDKRS